MASDLASKSTPSLFKMRHVRSSSAAPRQAGRCSCFIDECQLFYIHPWQWFNPCSARLLKFG
jgi:hypothetical protein